jgi:hypothetical protein
MSDLRESAEADINGRPRLRVAIEFDLSRELKVPTLSLRSLVEGHAARFAAGESPEAWTPPAISTEKVLDVDEELFERFGGAGD